MIEWFQNRRRLVAIIQKQRRHIKNAICLQNDLVDLADKNLKEINELKAEKYLLEQAVAMQVKTIVDRVLELQSKSSASPDKSVE